MPKTPKGVRLGGRQKGTKNKATLALDRQKDPLVMLGNARIKQILEGKLPCSVCKGVGKTKYQPAKGESHLLERTCQSCYGSKLEQLSPELIAKVALEIREYGYPKRKAIEVTGEGGQPIKHEHTLKFI